MRLTELSWRLHGRWALLGVSGVLGLLQACLNPRPEEDPVYQDNGSAAAGSSGLGGVTAGGGGGGGAGAPGAAGAAGGSDDQAGPDAEGAPPRDAGVDAGADAAPE